MRVLNSIFNEAIEEDLFKREMVSIWLLIINDFGLQPLKPDMRLTLLQILEGRLAKRSTIVTSQLPVNRWYEYINEPTLAVAICDRLAANAHKIELKGESLRKRKSN